MENKKILVVFLCICVAAFSSFLFFNAQPAKACTVDVHAEYAGHVNCNNQFLMEDIEGNLYCPICGWSSLNG